MKRPKRALVLVGILLAAGFLASKLVAAGGDCDCGGG